MESGASGPTVCVVGLGYVGLPLAVALSTHAQVRAYDVNEPLIRSLRAGVDPAREIARDVLISSPILFSHDPQILRNVDAIIVAVPTPIDATKRPDMSALRAAAREIGTHLSKDTLIILESTVYPGCTEDLFLPIVEDVSGLRVDEDFHLAYSPERVVPGDASRTLAHVDKLVAGRTPVALERALTLYRSFLSAACHSVSSIRVAEAAKVLENTQRDLNIALMNECALIFERAGIDTNEVIDAAATKWNFAPYRPGLVGGHCIGVDPYYLTHMAECLGYHPEVILAGRRVNDGMGRHVARKVLEQMVAAGLPIRAARVLVLGLTFKEGVSDLRNSRVVELVAELRRHFMNVMLHDPRAAAGQVEDLYGIPPVMRWQTQEPDVVVLAVPHAEYVETLPPWLREQSADGRAIPVVVDVRGALPRAQATFRL